MHSHRPYGYCETAPSTWLSGWESDKTLQESFGNIMAKRLVTVECAVGPKQSTEALAQFASHKMKQVG
jgi:hypothetical protein